MLDLGFCLLKLILGILLFLGFDSSFNTRSLWTFCLMDIIVGILTMLFFITPVIFWVKFYEKNPKHFDRMDKKHKSLLYVVPNVFCDVVFILGTCYANHPWLAFFTAISIAMQWNWVDFAMNLRMDILSEKK